jgi:hypothetical protein
MHSRLTVVLWIGLLMAPAGWIPSAGSQEWRDHMRSFASGQYFSPCTNSDGSTPRVWRTRIPTGNVENWWGKAITVSPQQIFEAR